VILLSISVHWPWPCPPSAVVLLWRAGARAIQGKASGLVISWWLLKECGSN